MKTHDIELQRIKAVRHDKGLIEVSVDALESLLSRGRAKLKTLLAGEKSALLG